MRVIATILAVERRRAFAERLRDQVAAHMPVEMSIKNVQHDLEDAYRRWRQLLEFATLQNSEWHLFLEDDQELTPEFFESLPDLLAAFDVDVWYLANRTIQIGQIGWHGRFRVNHIKGCVAGSHGLLYRSKHIPTLLSQDKMRPIDFIWWEKLHPHQHRHFQILRPVMARHVGKESTLHSYKHSEQLMEQPASI